MKSKHNKLKVKAELDYSKSVIVFDTNVLLTEPQAILNYPDADIIIPDTVLNEIDKLKTARVDPDLRFRGREVTRLLFELAEGQSFAGGISLPNGGTLRVVSFESNSNTLPDGFSTKTTDNKILATTYLLREEIIDQGKDKHLMLITNDLNMLLKAQTLDIDVRQFGNGDDLSWGKKHIIRPFQRYRVPLTILMISLALFAAVIVLAFRMNMWNSNSGSISTDYRNLLTSSQKNAYDALTTLKENSADTQALLTLADFYYGRAETEQASGDNSSMLTDSKTAIGYYEKYLSYTPTDADARADMATLYFYTGNTDRAIQEVAKVLESNPNHANANYNLGVFYYFGRHDLTSAANQMKKVMELTSGAGESDTSGHALYQQATLLLQQIKKDQKSDTTSSVTK
ncbi:MAG: tetratricopeptide repeat protein [Coriobacteriia bacterium]|nr:tetratricopeptide repeat protein [Coriobacteriia bacterium]